MTWWKDRPLLAALLVALILRTVPLAVWGQEWVCARDECTYIKLATRMAEGEGMTHSSGWLWAPGYPVLLAIHKVLTGYASTMKGTQVVVALVNVILLAKLALRAAALWNPDRDFQLRCARITAWLYAVSASQAFFAMSLWSEVVYTMLLLFGLIALDAVAPPIDADVPEDVRLDPRDRSTRRALALAAGVGAMVGCCVLFRGVATYMLPIFIAGVLWRRWHMPRAWVQALIVVVAAVAVVAPYSAHATKKFEAFVISDRTLGQMMWLGNNEFEPLTFDYGNGFLSVRAFKWHTGKGRERCASRKEALLRDECETALGIQWMKSHPKEFIGRMPLRVAQMLNPHSLLTRHLRWGRWRGLPQWADEAIVLWGALGSMLVMWVGPIGLAARGRRALGLVISGILLYHLAAISGLAGLSRYRIPLEPLLMVFTAQVLADPRQTLAIFAERRWRLAAALLSLILLVPLVLWFLPAGWPGWRHW